MLTDNDEHPRHIVDHIDLGGWSFESFAGLVPSRFRMRVLIHNNWHLSPYTDIVPIALHLERVIPAFMLPAIANPLMNDSILLDVLDKLHIAFKRAFPGLTLGFSWEALDERTGMFEFRKITLAQLRDLHALLSVVVGPSDLSVFKHRQYHVDGRTH